MVSWAQPGDHYAGILTPTATPVNAAGAGACYVMSAPGEHHAPDFGLVGLALLRLERSGSVLTNSR